MDDEHTVIMNMPGTPLAVEVEDLKQALANAVRELKEHNLEAGHVTPWSKIKHWAILSQSNDPSVLDAVERWGSRRC